MTSRTPQRGPGAPPAATLPASVAGALARCADAYLAGAVLAADLLPALLADFVERGEWRGHGPARDGFPLVFDFSSATDALMHTSAVVASSADPARALPLAVTLAERFGAGPTPPVALALAGLQAEGELSYGAWLRVRYEGATPSFRLQAEVPSQQQHAAQQPLLAALGVRSLLPAAPGPGATAVAYDVDDGTVEFVFRPDDIAPWQLERMAQVAGFGARFNELTEVIMALAGATTLHGLPAPGFAVQLSADNAPQRFSVSCDAGGLLGSDMRIRHAVLRLAANLGWDLGAYAAVSEPLRERRGAMMHTRLEFALGERGPVGFALQLRPPLSS